MSQLQISLLLYRIAAENDVSYHEVYSEIENAIDYAYNHQTPDSKVFWDKVIKINAVPSVHEVLNCILQNKTF